MATGEYTNLPHSIHCRIWHQIPDAGLRLNSIRRDKTRSPNTNDCFQVGELLPEAAGLMVMPGQLLGDPVKAQGILDTGAC